MEEKILGQSTCSAGVVTRPSATLPSREVLTVNVPDEKKFQLNEMELSRRNIEKKQKQKQDNNLRSGLNVMQCNVM